MQLIGLKFDLAGLCVRFSIGFDEDAPYPTAMHERPMPALDARSAVPAATNGRSGH